MKYRFYKTEENRWYIDIPDWKGSIADLEMVAGADTMLDELSVHGDEITLELSTEDKGIDYSILEFQKMTPGGADYTWGNKKVWLCDVTVFVFGGFPGRIYFRVSNE